MRASPAIYRVDTFQLLGQIIANPSQFGLTNVTDPAFDENTGTIAFDPNSYLFWDTVHPTTVVHGQLGTAAANAVPEPNSLLLLLAGSAILASAVVWRKR